MNRYTFFVCLLTCFLYFMKNADTKPLLRNEMVYKLREDIKRLAANLKDEQKRFKNHEEQNERKRQPEPNDNSVDNEDEPTDIFNFEDLMTNMAHEAEQAINSVISPDFQAQGEHAVPNNPGDEHADGIMVGIMEDEHENGSAVMNNLADEHAVPNNPGDEHADGIMEDEHENGSAVMNNLADEHAVPNNPGDEHAVMIIEDEPENGFAVMNNLENVHQIILDMMANMAENMLENNFDARIITYMDIFVNLFGDEVRNNLENINLHQIILNMMTSMAEDLPAVRDMLENNFEATLNNYMDILVNLLRHEPNPDDEPPM